MSWSLLIIGITDEPMKYEGGCVDGETPSFFEFEFRFLPIVFCFCGIFVSVNMESIEK